ncbi:hypothetical protein CK231_24475 [Mesorhizobium loti]|uniref:Uncharacterized protein n=1 Tax=Mesorhizobium japonicum TaxID=2066070 RepID=A0A3M9XDA8_9HYPH|nr:hypothetical protein [Mesorhizobium japonicum]PBB11533.1 hypothetical protein CK231_24475 [Mesorhizobium loti]QGX79248.1 hypothetical protein EB234_21940 [Mesorhizobium japonicum R7A]MUT28438.1 hypothetical protein [Mesorhizobium japonicum]PBB47196.1 hypothetical protein CK213_24255 [Mesorhizobium loti]
MYDPAERNKWPPRTQPAEDERLARLEKTARLKRLRSYASWLAPDAYAQFHDEIDCSALIEESRSLRLA